jgi:pimeloyl-ACP methyl ester carboxylesterase
MFKNEYISIFKITFVSFISVILIIAISIALFIRKLFTQVDLSKIPTYHPFKSSKHQKQYLNYYDSRAKQWPVPSTTKYIQTSFGKTFIRISGANDSPTLVLLPSVGTSSLMWIPNIKGLSEHFRVYAIDNVYDSGRSSNSRVMKQPDDIVSWLDELFTGLNLGDSINLMGLSLGGWETSVYTLHRPERLHKSVWIAPIATIMDIPVTWIWRGIIGAIPLKCCMYSMVNWAFADLVKKQDEKSIRMVKEIVDDAAIGLKCFKFKMPVTPLVLSDEELQRIKTPTFFIVGDNEVIYKATDAVNRLHKVAPQIKTEIIPNASHDITYVQADLLNERIIAFLKQ